MNDPRDSASPFGVQEPLSWNHAWNSFHNGGEKLNRSIALMKEAGAGWVRVDFLWRDLEPRRGCFEFGSYDRLVEALSQNGLKVLALL